MQIIFQYEQASSEVASISLLTTYRELQNSRFTQEYLQLAVYSVEKLCKLSVVYNFNESEVPQKLVYSGCLKNRRLMSGCSKNVPLLKNNQIVPRRYIMLNLRLIQHGQRHKLFHQHLGFFSNEVHFPGIICKRILVV